MIKYILLFMLIYCADAKSQNADALIKAEKDFEQSCLQHGIRDGFLAFVDSSGIVFGGKGPVNAKKFWSSLPAFEGVFSWSPSFAEMSNSGDWGYTTGNFEHRPKSLKDSVAEAGQYTTIWHKTKKGEWKYLLDIGNGHVHVSPGQHTKTIDMEKWEDGNDNGKGGMADQEKLFIFSFEKNISDAYQKFGSAAYILNLQGHMLVNSPDTAIVLISNLPQGLFYHPA
jgi:ketosteroid isomerase-like protein